MADKIPERYNFRLNTRLSGEMVSEHFLKPQVGVVRREGGGGDEDAAQGGDKARLLCALRDETLLT